jgi:hypothetical protein
MSFRMVACPLGLAPTKKKNLTMLIVDLEAADMTLLFRLEEADEIPVAILGLHMTGSDENLEVDGGDRLVRSESVKLVITERLGAVTHSRVLNLTNVLFYRS